MNTTTLTLPELLSLTNKPYFCLICQTRIMSNTRHIVCYKGQDLGEVGGGCKRKLPKDADITIETVRL